MLAVQRIWCRTPSQYAKSWHSPFRPIAAAWLLALLAGPLIADPPTLEYLFPAGGARGSRVTVECKGKFDWPVQADAPGLQVAVSDQSGQVQISIPSDLATDRVWLRLYNASGASEPAPFLISGSAEVVESEPNDSPAQAQSDLNLPVVVNGVLKGADADTFAIPLHAGQTLIAALDAHSRLGSPIDAVLQIANSQGIVLADNHDWLGLDPQISYQAKSAGFYLVRLFGFLALPNQSIALQGGNNCINRLSMTTGPLITHAIPLAVSEQSNIRVQLVGWNIPEAPQISIQTLGHPVFKNIVEVEAPSELRTALDTQQVMVIADEMVGCARVRHVSMPVSLVIDRPIDAPPVEVDLPHAITGRLKSPAQVDRYAISLKQGQQLLATVQSRTLGLLPDPMLRLFDSAGKQLAEVDDSAGGRDAIMAFTAPADGSYVVAVLDRHQAGGPKAYYLLTLRPEQEDFELTFSATSLVVPAGEIGQLPGNVLRRGAAGPITLNLEGLPEGMTCEPVVSAVDGETSKGVTLKISGNSRSYSGPIRVVGRMEQPRSLLRYATTPARLNAALPYLWLTVIAPTQ
ncbi:MAG TPA: hypothetical protein DCF63_15260 [Planctomycetaceae bacterium]|nr:hypothetical protein [Planctomycetaceae bacterium]